MDDEEREGKRCDVDCHFPGEYRGLDVPKAVERPYKDSALNYSFRLPARARVCTYLYLSYLRTLPLSLVLTTMLTLPQKPTDSERATLHANRRTLKERNGAREDSKLQNLTLLSYEKRVFKEAEIYAYYRRQGKTRNWQDGRHCRMRLRKDAGSS